MEEVVTKKCSKCGEEKSFDSYSKMPAGRFGLAAACKECCNKLSKENRKLRQDDSFRSKNDPLVRLQEFLRDAKHKFGEQFTYHQETFKGVSKKMQITCKKHSHTFLVTPLNHLKGNGSCKFCRNEKLKDVLSKTQEEFLQDCLNAHRDLYGYDRAIYRGAVEPVEIYCKRHEEYFWQDAKSHTAGSGCLKCAHEDGHDKLRLTQEEFLDKALSLRKGHYSYDKSVYVEYKACVIVTCKEHGDFPITPANLFSGFGCPKCANYGYNPDKPGSIYVLQSGNITKVGITNREVHQRVKEIEKSSGKKFDILLDERNDDGGIAKAIEGVMHLSMASDGKRVSEKFDGYTECFTDVDTDYIIYVIKNSAKILKDMTW